MLIVGTDIQINATVSGIAGGLTGITSIAMNYSGPTGTGSWTPVVDDAANGIIHYAMSPATNNRAGVYKIWVTVVKSSKTYKTAAALLRIEPEGTFG
jgi:hypothetical protein